MRSQRGHGTLGLQLSGSDGPVLLLQLATPFALLPLDAFAFLKREHFLVLDPQFATLKFKVVQNLDHGGRLLGRGEVGESQAPKYAVVKVVVERVGQRQVQLGHQLHQLFLLDSERDVLNDDGGGDQLIVTLRGPGGLGAHCATLEGARTEVGEGTGNARLLVEPSLSIVVRHIRAGEGVRGERGRTYRGETGATRARGGLQTGGGGADAPEGLGVCETIWIPGLRAGQIISIRVVVQRRVQAVQSAGVIASHGVIVEVDRHGTVGVELSGWLTMQGLLVTLGTRRPRRGIIVIHVLRLLITHGG